MAEPTSLAKQAVILDYATGQVLLEKNSTTKMPTSSMSKIMTTYMVFDALKAVSYTHLTLPTILLV